MVTVVPGAPARAPTCPVCGDAMRGVATDELAPDSFFCPKDGHATYTPRALEAATRRLAELARLATATLEGVEYLVKPDTNCPIDGRRDVCAAHRFLSRDYHAASVMEREFGKQIHARLKAAAGPALSNRGGSKVGPADPRRRL